MAEKYSLPKGTNDIYYPQILKWQYVESIFHLIAKNYNFQEIRTPIFEYTKVFKRENDSSDMVNKEMYTFEINGSSYTLRPEQTASVARAYVEHNFDYHFETPTRLYYFGPQFRYERPQKGRQRMFHQFGVEVISELNPYLDCETIKLGLDILNRLNIKKYKLLINSIGDSVSRENYRLVLRDYFKPNLHQLCDDCNRRFEQNVLRILDCKRDKDNPILLSAPSIRNYLSEESQNYFQKVQETLTALNIEYQIEDKLVRGLDYYSDLVFEIVASDDALGSQSTIFAGGRYDKLISYFGGQEIGGIGFAMGVERLILLYDFYNSQDFDKELDAYIVCLDQSLKLAALKIVSKLRDNDISAQMDFYDKSFKNQFKSLERNHAKYALIFGLKEASQNKVMCKKIATQEQELVDISQIVEYIKSQERENDEKNTQ